MVEDGKKRVDPWHCHYGKQIDLLANFLRNKNYAIQFHVFLTFDSIMMLTLSLVSAIVGNIVLIIMGLEIFCKVRNLFSWQTPNKSLLNAAYLCIICFIISNIFIGVCSIHDDNQMTTEYTICWYILIELWNIAHLFIILSLYIRLYQSLKHSPYQLSKLIRIVIIFLIFIYFLSCVTLVFVKSGTPFIIGCCISYLVIYITFMLILIKKLNKIGKDIAQTSVDIFINQQILSLNREQKSLSNILRKYLILFLIIMSFTQITLFIMLFDHLTKHRLFLNQFILCLYPIDSVINIIGLSLSLQFHKEIYSKCCDGCHKCIGLYFKKSAAMSLKDPHRVSMFYEPLPN